MLKLVRSDLVMTNQASEIKISRWPKKREFLAYYLLYKEFNVDPFNINEGVEVLMKKLCMNRKTAINVVKRLKKMNYLVSIDTLTLRCRDLLEILDSYLSLYMYTRLKKCSYKRS